MIRHNQANNLKFIDVFVKERDCSIESKYNFRDVISALKCFSASTEKNIFGLILKYFF